MALEKPYDGHLSLNRSILPAEMTSDYKFLIPLGNDADPINFPKSISSSSPFDDLLHSTLLDRRRLVHRAVRIAKHDIFIGTGFCFVLLATSIALCFIGYSWSIRELISPAIIAAFLAFLKLPDVVMGPRRILCGSLTGLCSEFTRQDGGRIKWSMVKCESLWVMVPVTHIQLQVADKTNGI